MTDLDEGQRAEFERLRKAIADEEAGLTTAFEGYNATVRAAYEELSNALGGYKAAVREFDRFHSGISLDLNDHFDALPEEWREGAEGRAYRDWVEAWDGAVSPSIDLPTADLTPPILLSPRSSPRCPCGSATTRSRRSRDRRAPKPR